MLDINGGEFVVLLIVAVLVAGPERLPEFARQTRSFVEKAREWVREGKEQVRAEMGDSAALSALADLDPRQFHPKRLAREVLDPPRAPAADGPPRPPAPLAQGEAAPFDADAT